MSILSSSCRVAVRLCVICLIVAGLANLPPAFGEKEENRAAAVRNVTDQELLIEIAVNDTSSLVRATAVKKLTDQFQLARIALEDDSKDGIVREAAIGKLTDPDLLARIARGDESYGKGLSPEVFLHLRTVAVRRVEDQAVMAQVALEGAPADTARDASIQVDARTLRMTAVDRLTDQTLLAKVALEGKAGDARKAAEQKLTDPASLGMVMRDDKDTDLRDAAKAKLAKALFKAATAGDSATVELVAKDFPPDLRDENGRTLLMLASKNGRVDLVKFLLESGVDVNAENVILEYVRMPNGAAAYASTTLTLSEIAAQSPGSAIVPGRRETALSLATQNEHPEIVELLTRSGAK
jgi:hypothetical protein